MLQFPTSLRILALLSGSLPSFVSIPLEEGDIDWLSGWQIRTQSLIVFRKYISSCPLPLCFVFHCVVFCFDLVLWYRVVLRCYPKAYIFEVYKQEPLKCKNLYTPCSIFLSWNILLHLKIFLVFPWWPFPAATVGKLVVFTWIWQSHCLQPPAWLLFLTSPQSLTRKLVNSALSSLSCMFPFPSHQSWILIFHS